MDRRGGKPKILIIDDDVDIRSRMKSILERRGYVVFTAGDGLEGLQKVIDNAIDIIYCDIVMPRMDGLTFLENVRKYNSRAEIIMITGCSTVYRCVEAIEKNACAYLTKPVSPLEILESIKRAARRIEEKDEMLKVAYAAGSPKEK